MDSFFKNKKILITGACGTVGQEIISKLVSKQKFQPREIIGVDNNESGLFFLDQQFLSNENVRFILADIRSLNDMKKCCTEIDIIFHCAAFKHVILTEKSPEQAIETNINGVQNLIEAAFHNNVKKVIFTSSDKAVNPTNVMGTSKLMGERLMTAANSNKQGVGPVFASTRFGNVLGSSGSVIPIFHNQIASGGPVTLTDENMTRFVMSVQESVQLVMDSAKFALGGEVFVTKMPVVRISDLASAMIREIAPKYGYMPKNIEIKIIGTKPGEKLYEELMSEEETRRSLELQNYFSVLPAFRGIYENIEYSYKKILSTNITNAYVSSNEESLTVNSIRKFLKKNHLLEIPNNLQKQRYWPGDK